MPGDSEHPVTVGDLICAERRDGEGGHGPGYISRRPATVADLVSALRAEGVLREVIAIPAYLGNKRQFVTDWIELDE